MKDVNKNSFAHGEREGDGKCKYKGLFVGALSWLHFGSLLRYVVKLLPEGGGCFAEIVAGWFLFLGDG